MGVSSECVGTFIFIGIQPIWSDICLSIHSYQNDAPRNTNGFMTKQKTIENQTWQDRSRGWGSPINRGLMGKINSPMKGFSSHVCGGYPRGYPPFFIRETGGVHSELSRVVLHMQPMVEYESQQKYPTEWSSSYFVR